MVTVTEEGAIHFWDVPAPVSGDPERLWLEVEVETRRELDGHGLVRELTADDWQRRRRLLQEPDGRPAP
jgi:hypothetical protein